MSGLPQVSLRRVQLAVTGASSPTLNHPSPAAPAASAVFLVSVAWPTLHLTSYARWRLPALSALRLLLFRWAGGLRRHLRDGGPGAQACGPHVGRAEHTGGNRR